MDAVEKRARKLLIAACPSLKEEYFENSPHMTAINLHEALVAVRSALTPPEGYVLVPVAPSVAMLSAGKNVNQDCEEDDPSWGVADVWGAMLAARPEAP